MRASTRTCRRAHVVTSWRGPGRLATAILEVLGGSGPFCRFLLLPARPPRRRLLLCGLFKDARTGADSRCVLAERLAAVESRPPARSWCGGPEISGPGAGPGGGIFACAFQARELWEGSELPQVASALSRPAASDFLRRFALLPTNGTQTQSREAEKQRSREESPGAAGGWGARFYPGSVPQRLLWNRSEAFCPKASTRRPQCGAA